MSSATQICNLLYRYAELMDAGDLDAVTALFRQAKLKIEESSELQDSTQMLAIWQRYVRIYPCGTPRTKHVITNPILLIDETAGRATCRSYYTVLQATDELALQVVGSGRYHDEFERADGIWRFSYRDYSLFDLRGRLDAHLNLLA